MYGLKRGILNIFTYCKEAGLPAPEYDFVTHFVCLTIHFKNPLAPYITGEGRNGGVNNLSDSLKKVYSRDSRKLLKTL